MPLVTTARKLLHDGAKIFGLRVQRLAPSQIRGIEPMADVQFLLRNVPGPTIFDVGANDGETTATILGRLPSAKVIAFEPFATAYDKLVQRYKGFSKVRVENMALGDAPGTAELNLYSGDRMNSLLNLNDSAESPMSGFRKVGAKPVNVDTLDNYCHINAIPRIHLLKIDTQGYDLNVLKGAERLLRSGSINVIQIEINFVPMYARQASFSELHGFLTSHGYRIVDFYNHVWLKGHAAWCDACYVLPESFEASAG